MPVSPPRTPQLDPRPAEAAVLDPLPRGTALLVVDLQERLLPAMDARQQPIVEKATLALLALWEETRWPVRATEQYPKGLGPTRPSLAAALAAAGAPPPYAKTEFSALGVDAVRDAVREAPAVVVVGVETHVCVLETVRELLALERVVYVPWDGVASRRDEDRQTALAAMARAGARVTSSESLLFQHLGKAGGEAFRRLSRMIR